MHTDEYEISLRRELNVCADTLRGIRKDIDALKERYADRSDLLLEQETLPSAEAPGLEKDREAWRNYQARLLRWEELERQYREAYAMMRI